MSRSTAREGVVCSHRGGRTKRRKGNVVGLRSRPGSCNVHPGHLVGDPRDPSPQDSEDERVGGQTGPDYGPRLKTLVSVHPRERKGGDTGVETSPSQPTGSGVSRGFPVIT